MNDSKICPSNLGPQQKRRRLLLGIVMFVLASVLAIFSAFRAVPPFLRAAVFFPYFLSILGFLQAKERTCVVFAAKGIQDLGRGEERVANAELSRLLKIKGQKITIQSFLFAALLTVAVMLVR